MDSKIKGLVVSKAVVCKQRGYHKHPDSRSYGTVFNIDRPGDITPQRTIRNCTSRLHKVVKIKKKK